MVMFLRPEPKAKQYETNTIVHTLIDDDEKEVEVEITYDYEIYTGGWWNVTMVNGYDYKLKGSANIKDHELCRWVMDEIRDAEPRSVTFY